MVGLVVVATADDDLDAAVGGADFKGCGMPIAR